ncbi:MAG: hypothetical protein ACXAEB_06260 [Candidatus Thorarchaeota archaeon]|jgi:hypothetical protein
MALQIPIPNDTITALVGALLLLILPVSILIAWTRRTRARQVEDLEALLLRNISYSITELSASLSRRPMDKSTILRIVDRAHNAILNFSGSGVVSSDLLGQRLRKQLIENSVVHVDKVSNRWDLTASQIGSLIERISREESLDVVTTKDGDYILIPELKERIRDAFEIHGRVDINSEAQRLRVDPSELIRLVDQWGWKTLPTSDGSLIFLRWLRTALENMVERMGFLESSMVSERLHLSSVDSLRAMKVFNWSMISTIDGRLIPAHLLEQELRERLSSDGYLEIESEEQRLKVDSKKLIEISKDLGLDAIVTTDNTVMTKDYLRERILDDLELTGMITPSDEAELLGISSRRVTLILSEEEGLHKSRLGRFVRLSALRRWLLEEVKQEGAIKMEHVTRDWGLINIELLELMKKFGLGTITSRSGDFLSIALIRQKIRSDIASGVVVDKEALAKELDLGVGYAEAILSQIEVDALLTKSGSLVPIAIITDELANEHERTGVLDPGKEAITRGLDISDIERLIESLNLKSLRNTSGRLISVAALVRQMRHALATIGIYDLKEASRKSRIPYVEMANELESHTKGNEIVVDSAGAVVNMLWIKLLKEYASENEAIKVTAFAKTKGIRRDRLLALLRRFLKGAYVSRSDTFFIHLDD